MNFIAAIRDIENVDIHQPEVNRAEYLRDQSNPFEFYDGIEFQARFRFSKDTTMFICDMMREALVRPTRRHSPIPVELQVLSALRFFATGSFQVVIGDLSHLSQTSISRCVAKVSRELANQRANYIVMPTENEAFAVQEEFYNIAQGCSQKNGGLANLRPIQKACKKNIVFLIAYIA